MSLRYWHKARWELMQTKSGIEALNHVENTYSGSDLILEYKDISPLAKAYIGELSEFIDCAQSEKKRILAKGNLI